MVLSVLEEIEIRTQVKLGQKCILQQVTIGEVRMYAAYFEMHHDASMR